MLENLIFNLTDEITMIKNSVEYIADKNNDVLTVEIDTAIPEFLIGDKLRLSQIIMNLVSNALKFTKNGEVAITADLKKVEAALKNHKIDQRITADVAEAKKFSFSGTPGYLINGVSLKGAYPASAFKEIIDRQLASQN